MKFLIPYFFVNKILGFWVADSTVGRVPKLFPKNNEESERCPGLKAHDKTYFQRACSARQFTLCQIPHMASTLDTNELETESTSEEVTVEEITSTLEIGDKAFNEAFSVSESLNIFNEKIHLPNGIFSKDIIFA